MFASTSRSTLRQLPSTARRFTTTAPSSKPSPSSSSSSFKFHISPAFHGKPTHPEQDSDSKSSKSPRLAQGFLPGSPVALWRDEMLSKAPHDKGAGHDFYFITEGRNPESKVIGIADGVGGWEESGVNPAHFAQGFMYSCEQYCKTAKSSLPLPLEIMESGFKGVKAEKAVIAGSSTACIITLDSVSGIMNAANLGDSTFILVRDNKVIHAQPSQTHFFNAPRQLSKLPAGSGAGNFADTPKNSDLVQLQLQADDILVMATDGFSDNVWNRELEQLVTLILQDAKEKGTDADKPALISKLAQSCCQYARICSFKADKESPFEVEARKYGHEFKGGKVDDVCVVAVLVANA